MSNKLISRGFTGSATSLTTSGFLTTLIRRVGRSSRKAYDAATEKIREYYVSAMLLEINEDELVKPISGTDFGQINTKNRNCSSREYLYQ